MKIKNIANTPKGVPGFPIFEAGEIRQVSKEEGEKLILCPFLEEVADVVPGTNESKKKVLKSTKEAK